jgi:1-acyl-sn-glycerol-3-phosphate acyltransferase
MSQTFTRSIGASDTLAAEALRAPEAVGADSPGVVEHARAQVLATGMTGVAEAAGAASAAGTADVARTGQRRHSDLEAAERLLPRGDLGRTQRWFRHWFSRTVAGILMKGWFRITIVHPERFLHEPCVYAFNHMSWMDPLLLLGTFPSQPRLFFYGPKEPNLREGGRNRFMFWTGIPVPFSPLKDDLLTSVRYVQAVFDTGGALAIAPEGTIHVHEGDLLPFEEGAAYLALRAGVPIVPVAITGISVAGFRGRVLIRLGEAIRPEGRPTRGNVARYSAITWHALRSMVDGDVELRTPGRFTRWLTDLFNDWGEGGREAAARRHGPDPASVRIPPAGGALTDLPRDLGPDS